MFLAADWAGLGWAAGFYSVKYCGEREKEMARDIYGVASRRQDAPHRGGAGRGGAGRSWGGSQSLAKAPQPSAQQARDSNDSDCSSPSNVSDEWYHVSSLRLILKTNSQLSRSRTCQRLLTEGSKPDPQEGETRPET